MLVLSIILGILLIISVIALRNLLIKVEKYEDVVQDQVRYLQNISKTITESQKHCVGQSGPQFQHTISVKTQNRSMFTPFISY